MRGEDRRSGGLFSYVDLEARVPADHPLRPIRAIVDDAHGACLLQRRGYPERFSRSRAVGAHFGLVPRKYQSGTTDRNGRITKAGDVMVRTALYEAANVLLTRVTRWSPLKAWAVRLAQRIGGKRAKVALARKLAVILHRIWIDGTTFTWTRERAMAAI